MYAVMHKRRLRQRAVEKRASLERVMTDSAIVKVNVFELAGVERAVADEGRTKSTRAERRSGKQTRPHIDRQIALDELTRFKARCIEV